MFILRSLITSLWWKQAMGLKFFPKKREMTKSDKEPSKNHQESTRNQPEPRKNWPGHELSAALINFSVSFFIYLAFRNQKDKEYAIFQISTFAGYYFQQTAQVMVML